MRKIIFTLFISCIYCTYSYSQIKTFNDQPLADTILCSPQPLKIIYILCDYCQSSIERFPKVLEKVKMHKSIAFFPICAQDSLEIAEYLNRNSLSTPIYLINQHRKRKLISFYNPIKAVCKYLTKWLKISTEKTGASDYFILNKNNQIILSTNYDMQDEQYFKLLENLE